MPTTRNFAKDVLHILSVTTTTDYLHQSGNIKDKVDGQLDILIVYHNLGTEKKHLISKQCTPTQILGNRLLMHACQVQIL